LEATIGMTRKSLDQCRAKRTELSAKLSRMEPAHSALELELQKSVDAQVELQQELIAMRQDVKNRTSENVSILKENAKLKKETVVQLAANDDLKGQISQLRQLKIRAEQNLQSAAAIAAKDLEDKSAEALRLRAAKFEKDDELRKVKSEKMHLETELAASVRRLEEVS